MIDTRATGSVISDSIVNKLNLKPLGKIKVFTGSKSSDEFFQYAVTIHLPADLQNKSLPLPNGMQNVVVPTIWVSQVTNAHGNPHISEQGFDVIIGMDILLNSHCTILGPNLFLTF